MYFLGSPFDHSAGIHNWCRCLDLGVDGSMRGGVLLARRDVLDLMLGRSRMAIDRRLEHEGTAEDGAKYLYR